MTLCIDHDNKTAFVANEMKEQTYRYRVGGYDMNYLGPTGIITTDKKLTSEQYEVAKKHFERIHSAPGPGRVAVFEDIYIPSPTTVKKKKKCTHEHVSRGICLYCGEGVV